MFVASLCQISLFEKNAQAGAEDRLLDIVRSERITRKEVVHITIAYQPAEILAASGVDNRRAADNQRFASRPTVFYHFPRDRLDGHAFGLFSGDTAVHELEGLPGGFAVLWKDTHPGVSHNNLHLVRDIGHRDAACDLCFRIDDNATVHLLVFYRDPISTEPNLRPLVGGTVETLGKRARNIALFKSCILYVGRDRTVIANGRKNIIQYFRGIGHHINQGITRI